MAETKLETCPFCGEEAAVRKHPVGERKVMHQIGCDRCGYALPWRQTMRQAARDWNRRAGKGVGRHG